MDETICPYCKSINIIFHIGMGKWHCNDCMAVWDKFEKGMENKIGLNCKWGYKKKYRKDLPENHKHGKLWCNKPSDYPFQTSKPFTCRCKEFKPILSDCINCSKFWESIELGIRYELTSYKLTWTAWGDLHEKYYNSENELIEEYESCVLYRFNNLIAYSREKIIYQHKSHREDECPECKRIREKWGNKREKNK